MKKNYFIVGAVMVTCLALTTVSCTKEDQFDDFYNDLSVDNNVPLTKSAESPEGDGQHLGGGDTDEVPQLENECFLNAMITMAKKRRIPVTVVETDENGTIITKTYNFGGARSAAEIYDKVRTMAMSGTYAVCDTNGAQMSDSNGNPMTETYSGGAMTATMAAEVGKRAGILTGERRSCIPFNELVQLLKDSSWKSEHPNGTYLIGDQTGEHAYICNGVTSSGAIKVHSARGGDEELTQKSHGFGLFTLIY
jgi:hypothetical protein